MSVVAALLTEVKQECPDCGGMGTILSLRSTATPAPRLHCFACRGRGWVLSDIGRPLADTLRAGLDGGFAASDHTH